jgi:uncharacterized protein YpbB
MFREGKSVREIAADRSLTVGTIEGHLQPYVAKGMIDVFRLMDPVKVERVLETAKELDTTALFPLKDRLGEEVTYSELRFVMAHRLSKSQ